MGAYIPNLIHPIDVTIERLTRSEMVMDLQAREPYHGARSSTTQTFVLPAQIKWSAKDDDQPQEGGVREVSNGYILCRILDMETVMGVGERLKRGDRIVTIGNISDLDLYVVREEPIAHLQQTTGASMIKYHFEDRHPVRQVGDL